MRETLPAAKALITAPFLGFSQAISYTIVRSQMERPASCWMFHVSPTWGGRHRSTFATVSLRPIAGSWRIRQGLASDGCSERKPAVLEDGRHHEFSDTCGFSPTIAQQSRCPGWRGPDRANPQRLRRRLWSNTRKWYGPAESLHFLGARNSPNQRIEALVMNAARRSSSGPSNIRDNAFLREASRRASIDLARSNAHVCVARARPASGGSWSHVAPRV